MSIELLKDALREILTEEVALIKPGGGTYSINARIDVWSMQEASISPVGVIQPGDMRGFFYPSYDGVKVELGDWIETNDGTFRVIDVRTYSLEGEAIYVEANLRKVGIG